MKILYIVPYVPNLIRVRPYNLIRYLAERGNEVTVVTLQSSAGEQADAVALEKLVKQVIVLDLPKWRSFWNCLLALPSEKPLQSVYCWQPALARQLSGMFAGGARPFDIIHVEHIRGVRYGQALKAQTDIPVVWDSVDCISFLFEQAVAQAKSGFGRFMTRLDLNRTRHFEGHVVDAFDQVLVTSPADREAFIRLRPSTAAEPPITVLPNGVDLDKFQPEPSLERSAATIIVSGKMSYHANVSMVLHLAENIMPQVWQQRPEAKLMVVGKDPHPSIQKLTTNPQVVVTGTVPAIEPYLQRATISVAPIPYGAGIQNKVLEAMACATPVVVSAQAAKAITAVPGQDYLVADRPDAFAEAILRLLNDVELRKKMGEQGRAFMEQHHDWRQIALKLEQQYAALLT